MAPSAASGTHDAAVQLSRGEGQVGGGEGGKIRIINNESDSH